MAAPPPRRRTGCIPEPAGGRAPSPKGRRGAFKGRRASVCALFELGSGTHLGGNQCPWANVCTLLAHL
eukprot:569175-Prymnesium_polylepis.1